MQIAQQNIHGLRFLRPTSHHNILWWLLLFVKWTIWFVYSNTFKKIKITGQTTFLKKMRIFSTCYVHLLLPGFKPLIYSNYIFTLHQHSTPTKLQLLYWFCQSTVMRRQGNCKFRLPSHNFELTLKVYMPAINTQADTLAKILDFTTKYKTRYPEPWRE